MQVRPGSGAVRLLVLLLRMDAGGAAVGGADARVLHGGGALGDGVELEVLGRLACTLFADGWRAEDVADGVRVLTTRKLVQFPRNTIHD